MIDQTLNPYTDETINITGQKYLGESLINVEEEWLRWFYDQNLDWYRQKKDTFENANHNKYYRNKFRMMEYIEENLDNL